MLSRDALLCKTFIVALVIIYGATLGILGFAHVHLLLHATTPLIGTGGQGSAHHAAPTCVLCFRLNTSQPNVPEQQLFPGELPESRASMAAAAAPVRSISVTAADGRAPPLPTA